MDEITLDDKKYVSSKRAAKLTGYAKDYVGQLCREGRVPARLVGRSWYVLESAIQDHRFGEARTEDFVNAKSVEVAPMTSTWESPKYVVDTLDEAIPSVNRLNTSQKEDVSGNLRDNATDSFNKNWSAWLKNESGDDSQEKTTEDMDIAVQVPIRTTYDLPVELMPRVSLHRMEGSVQQSEPIVSEDDDDDAEDMLSDDEYADKQRMGAGVRTTKALVSIGLVVAIITSGLALLGSGLVDTIVLSNSQVAAVSGAAVYKK